MINLYKKAISKTLIFSSLILLVSCADQVSKKSVDTAAQLEKDLEMYQDVWNAFLAGDTSVINQNNFTEVIFPYLTLSI